MRAKLLRFACVLFCMLALLCGCKDEVENQISDAWQFNEVSHWHICDRADCSEHHDADSHQWDTGVIKQDATCELTGQKVYTCTVCQATRTEVIASIEHTPASEWNHDNSAHWYLCVNCGQSYDLAAHKWYRATTSETGEYSEELYVCIICNLITEEKPAVLEDPNAKPVYLGKIPSNIPTLGNGEYVFIPHMNGNNFTVESSTNAKISTKRGEKTPFGKSVLIDVPVGAGSLTLKPDSIMSKEEVEKLVADGNSEIVASFSIEITGGKWWGGPVKVSTPWSGLSYSTDKYSENKASLIVKFSAADLLTNYDRICADGLFVLEYANQNYDSYRFTLTPFEIKTDHNLGAQWEQDENDHYHTCTICGIEKDRASHTLTGNVCSVCGEVKRYLFQPKADGSNFRVSNTGNVAIRVYRGETELGNVAVIDVPQNANTITITPNEILDKAKLEALLAEGVTEIRAQFTTRITGGKWWAGSVKISADWSGKSYTFPAAEFKNNLLGPVTIKFSVRDALENYNQISQDGLFRFFFDNQAHDTYQISFNGFELVTDHEWSDLKKLDDSYHARVCSICAAETDKQPHTWEIIEGIDTCNVCGYEDVMAYILNDFSDATGIKLTYLNNAGVAGESTVDNNRIKINDGQINIWVPQWTKSGSLEFYMPLMLTKGEAKELLDSGITVFAVTIKQGMMNDHPRFGLTNTVSADWTDTTYAIKNTDDLKTITFSLQDLYDNYESISNGTVALFKFSIAGLAANDGGVWDGVAWVSSTYNIWIQNIEAVPACTHSVDSQWQFDSDSHWKTCTACGEKMEVAEHIWETISDGKECSVCGYEDLLSYVLNDFADSTGIKVTYLNNAGVAGVSTADNNRIKITDGLMNVWVPQWTKSGSLEFYMPLMLTKSDIKDLLDSGITMFAITIKQGMMNDHPRFGLTNTVSADWTDDTYAVKNTDDWKTLSFSLQDLYDNYEAVSNGTMALFKFSIAGLAANDGGVWDGSAWVSSSYNIWIQNIEAVLSCTHSVSTEWYFNGENHWKVCTVCGDKLDLAEHTWKVVSGSKVCAECGCEDTLPTVLNDFTDLTGVKVTYLNNAGVAGVSTADNNRIKITDGLMNVWVPQWTKSGSLEFYMPLMLTKSDIKDLLDSGITMFAITIKQGMMNDHPRFGLTNTVSADWTDDTYAVKNTDDWKTLSFSLQDLYDNYEAVSNGTMALFKFSIAGLAANDGGVWDGSAWVSSSYNIWIQNIEAVLSCTHSVSTEWYFNSENHWKVCTVCGDKLDLTEHTWKVVSGSKVCAECGREDTLPTVLNDFTDLTGVKVTYLNNAGVAKEANAANGGVKLTTANNLNIWIAPWTKSKSLQFFMPLNLTKEEVKALLNLGCTEFIVSLDQTFMNESPWWGLTNTVSADWTDATYTISHDAGWVEMIFSLQDLYDNYDAINSGEIAMFRFAMSIFSETDGGFWDGKAWVSSSHNIYLSSIKVKLED